MNNMFQKAAATLALASGMISTVAAQKTPDVSGKPSTAIHHAKKIKIDHQKGRRTIGAEIKPLFLEQMVEQECSLQPMPPNRRSTGRLSDPSDSCPFLLAFSDLADGPK